jgi:elongation factor G
MAFEPKTKGDEDKLSMALMRLAEEDPTLKVRRDPEAGQTIVSGMGDIHLDVVLEKLKAKFGVDVLLDLPKVPYRETIRTRAEAEHKHKKQTGGHGQYGHVFLRLEPLPRGGGYEFVDEIFGGAIPKQYIPGVEKGVKEAMQEGVLAGYPVVDVRVTLYDGSYHVVDSSELSFKIAGAQAFRKAMQAASPVLLEPIMNLEVIVPENFMGDVIGDLNGRRGRILGMESKGSLSVIKAQVPMAEILKYAIDLRSLTQGRGRFSISFSHYEEVPDHIAQGIMERARKQAG